MTPTRANHPAHGAGGTTVMRSMQLALHGLFVALLVLGAVRSTQSAGHPLACAIGSALLLVWYAVGVLAARSSRRGAGAGWLIVLLLGWGGLLALSAEFSWVAFALFFLALHLLPRVPGVLVVGLTDAAVIVAQLTGPRVSTVGAIIGPVIGAVVALGISWIYAGLHAEAMARQRLVDELVATQDAVARAQREAGVVAERSRLARDIHDTLAQSFSSIVLLSRAGLAGPAEGERLRGLLQQIEQTAASGLQDSRTVVRALAPDELDQAPLPAAMDRLLARLGRQVGIPAELVVDGDARPLPTSVEVALLRLAQGALANVQQHARATRVTMTLTYHDDAVQLDVVDDGVGFDPHARVPAAGGGFGLRAMRERLADVGGTLAIESAPGDGTAVSADVPVRARQPLPAATEPSPGGDACGSPPRDLTR